VLLCKCGFSISFYLRFFAGEHRLLQSTSCSPWFPPRFFCLFF